jgi:hypothetical protein
MKRLVGFVLSLTFAAFAHTTAVKAVETCHAINATGSGQITSQTATGATTISQISDGGLLQGTTSAELAFTSIDFTTFIATFEGPLVLTTKHGTLDLFTFNGIYNLATGEFSSDSIVTGGTGRFDDANGGLYFHGFVYPDGSFFDDEISGRICLTLP